MSNTTTQPTETISRKYIIGEVFNISKTVTLAVTKFDSFGGVPHYGIQYVISLIGQPSYARFGWMPCELLENMDIVKLYNLEA